MKKKYTYWLLILVLAFISNGCEDFDVKVGGDPGIDVNVTISPEILDFSADADEATISVVTNMEDKYISIAFESDDDSWCTAELEGNNIKVSVTENIRYSSRAIELKVKVFNESKVITINQEAKEFVVEPTHPIDGAYKIKVPSMADFEKTKIYKAMDGEQKIVEICLEYLNNDQISTRAIVAYVGAGGAADYTDGMVIALVDKEGNMSSKADAGGRVIFNSEDNTLEYVPGTYQAASVIYVSGYGITFEEQENDDKTPAKEFEAEAYLVRDLSGNSYPVVKVGCEVWLGSNLRTTKFDGGEEIPLVDKAGIANYKKEKPFATYPRENSDLDPAVFGYLYGPATVKGDYEDLLARSIIDGNWRVSTGGGDANGIMGTATDWQRLFKYVGKDQLGALLATGYNWNNGGAGEFDLETVSNITGLSIVAAGEMYNIGGDPGLIGSESQAFFFYGGGTAQGYNFAERDGRVADQAGVRTWSHDNDACSIRLVRIDQPTN